MSLKQPKYTETQALLLAEQHYALNIISSTNVGSYVDQNFQLKDKNGNQYILKIHDANEPLSSLDMQSNILDELRGQLRCVQIPEVYKNTNNSKITQISDDDNIYNMRLLSYLPGSLLEDLTDYSSELWVHLGQVLAQMDIILASSTQFGANRINYLWDLKNLQQQRIKLNSIVDRDVRRLVDYFLLQYEERVVPNIYRLPEQIVHNDISRHAVLVNKNIPDKVSGIFDFGDTLYTCRIMNLAITLTYASLDESDPLMTCSSIIGGYTAINNLTEIEIELLYYMITGRICLYLLNSHEHKTNQLDNAHSQMKVIQMIKALNTWIAINPLKATDCFRLAAGFDSSIDEQKKAYQSALEGRSEHVGQSLALHYKKPLRLIGGALQYMYDDQGRSYFDCVNNVCQWGHCHPTIARASRQQTAILNTNSRYIYDQLSEYATRLAESFPDPLNVVMFVNSGTEANDLALRMARTYTGKKDILVMEKAYHGNSTAVTEISPNRLVGKGRPGVPKHVHTVMLTDTYRGPYKINDPKAGIKYADSLKQKLIELEANGRDAAAFICESFVGTGGQYRLPEGYLKNAYSHARNKGLICIADEVQMGFGRSGDQMWCFESQDVVPDIVTIGKPIGNGHPMAAVITTKEIATAFNNGIPFFNTFGGNPISCAIGMAVLDVLEQEQLRSNVQARHQQFMTGFNALKEKYEVIGDVRGIGLYLGIEMVNGENDNSTNGQLAAEIVEAMLAKGIFFNTNGDDKNILKIKPMLIINESETKWIIETLDTVLSELTTG